MSHAFVNSSSGACLAFWSGMDRFAKVGSTYRRVSCRVQHRTLDNLSIQKVQTVFSRFSPSILLGLLVVRTWRKHVEALGFDD